MAALLGPGATLGPRGSYKVAVSHTIKNSVLRKDVRAAAVPQTQQAPDHRPAAAGQNVPAREKPGFVLYRGKFLLRLGASRSEPGSRLTSSGWLVEEGLFSRKQARSFGFPCHLLDCQAPLRRAILRLEPYKTLNVSVLIVKSHHSCHSSKR